MEKKILRRIEIEKAYGLSCSTIYHYMDTAGFPRPIKLGVRHVGWIATEVDAWFATRPRSHPQHADAAS